MSEEYKTLLRYWLEKGNIIRYHTLLYKLDTTDGMLMCCSVDNRDVENEFIIEAVNSFIWSPSVYSATGITDFSRELMGLSAPASHGELQLLSLSPFRQPSSLRLNLLYERLYQRLYQRCVIPIRVNNRGRDIIHYVVNSHGVLHYRVVPDMDNIAASSFFVSDNNVILEDYIRGISTKLLLFFGNDLIVR